MLVTDVLCFRSLRRSLITHEPTGCWVQTGESSPTHTLDHTRATVGTVLIKFLCLSQSGGVGKQTDGRPHGSK